MKKGFFIGIVAVLSAALIFSGVKFARETGLLSARPKPAYLLDDEADMRPAYEQFSKKEQAVYEALLRGICDFEEEIPLPYEISGDTYSKIYCTLEKQEGQLFYIDSTYYTAEKISEAKIIYREDVKKIPGMQSEFDSAVEKGLSGVTLSAGEYDAVMRIHDYLIRSCKYVEESQNGYSSTAYGCLVDKKANCEGYAKAFSVLASKAGLKNVLVTGVTDKGENHAWNQVCVNGMWYNIDVTWDDTDVAGEIGRLYFLCNDKDFGRTHMPDKEHFEPFICNGSEENFYIMNGLFAHSVEEAETIIRREIRKGSGKIDIKFETNEIYDSFKRLYIEEKRIFDLLLEDRFDYYERTEIAVQENADERCLSIKLK